MNTLHHAFTRWLSMTPEQRAKWEPIRQAGAFRFVATRGVACFGGLFAAAGCASDYVYALEVREILQRAFPGEADPLPSFMRDVLPGTIVASLLAGALWGALVWLFQEWFWSLPHPTN